MADGEEISSDTYSTSEEEEDENHVDTMLRAQKREKRKLKYKDIKYLAMMKRLSEENHGIDDQAKHLEMAKTFQHNDFDKVYASYLNHELGNKDKFARRTIRSMKRELKKQAIHYEKVELEQRKHSFLMKLDQVASQFDKDLQEIGSTRITNELWNK